MFSTQYSIGHYYRIETISHLLTAQFNGEHQGQYQFVIVDGDDFEPVGVVLEFSEEEIPYAMITPHAHSESA